MCVCVRARVFLCVLYVEQTKRFLRADSNVLIFTLNDYSVHDSGTCERIHRRAMYWIMYCVYMYVCASTVAHIHVKK